MKKYLPLLIAAILLNLATLAQSTTSTGMNFEHLPSWQEILTKAKKENKMIFLDCYTTWCGPCKMMSSQVFTQKEVGDFYNANFINTKVQLDTTDADNEYVKGWYKDGQELARRYSVRAYPTYLVFNSNGEIIHRFVGSMPGSAFIEAGREILNPDNQYYTQVRKYEAGDKSPQLLLKLIDIAGKSYDQEGEKKFTDAYLSTQTDLYTKDNIKLLYKIAKTSNDKGFEIALNEADKADKILENAGASKKIAKRIILNEALGALMGRAGTPDFDAFDKSLNEKYPKYAKEVSDYARMYYYMNNKNWSGFVTYADAVVQAGDVPSGNLNSFAWTAFENVKDKALLEKALGWSKQSLKDGDNAAFLDTYANLLYKTGNNKEAIEQQTKALEAARKEGGDIAAYEQTLNKMKKGVPTWEN